MTSPPTDRQRPDVLLWLIAVYLLFEVGRLQQILPLLGRFRPALLLSVAALGVLVTRSDFRRRIRALRHPIWLAIALIGLLGVTSVVDSVSQGRTFGYVTGTYLKNLVVVSVIYLGIRGKRDAEFVIGAIFVAIATYGFFAIRHFDVSFGNRLGELYTYDANDLAQVILVSIPFALFTIRYADRKLVKLACWVAAAVLMLLFVRTGSRGGFLGFAAALGYVLFAGSTISTGKRIAIATSIGLILAVLGTYTGYWSFVGTLTDLESDYNLTSETGRIAVWGRAIGYMLSNPIAGVGMGAFPSAEGHLSGMQAQLGPGVGWKWSAAHNSFLQVGAELGFPGLIVYCVLWYRALTTAYRISRNERVSLRTRRLGTALLVSLISFLVPAFFLSQAYSSLFFTLVLIVAALDREVTRWTAARGRTTEVHQPLHPAARRPAFPVPPVRHRDTAQPYRPLPF